MQSSNNKNMFCRSVTGKGACTARGGVCRFAHTIDEIFPVLCKYGDKCNRHKNSPQSCMFVHPDQNINDYANARGFIGNVTVRVKKVPSVEFKFSKDDFPGFGMSDQEEWDTLGDENKFSSLRINKAVDTRVTGVWGAMSKK